MLTDRSAVEERLKAIAAQLIAAHRRHDYQHIVPYAKQAGLPVEGQPAAKLFAKTIQVFHPDRLALFWDQIEAARKAGDRSALAAYERMLEQRPAVRSSPVRDDFDDEEEDYGFDEDDFGYDVHQTSADEAFFRDEGDDDWDPDAGTFYSAVKRALFGNLEFYPEPSDLRRLEGELDLSDWDLNDLEGIGYCTGITALNLARNNLDNLYPLKDLVKLEALDLAENDLEDADAVGNLVNLKELDLSGNEIDDVAFLSRLPNLKYVDLTGNPIRTRAVVDRLEGRGVIVIAD